FLDVVDSGTLNVYFINPLKAGAVDKEHLRIEGEEGIRPVSVVSVNVSKERVLTVKVDTQARPAGTRPTTPLHSAPAPTGNYTLRLNPDARHLKLDPLLSAVSF